MNQRRMAFLCAAMFVIVQAAFFSAPATAQRRGRTPHLAYAYPAGCERGMPTEIVIGGQHLKDVNEVYIAGQGVKVEIIDWYRPLTNGEYNNLRMKMRETRERLAGQAALTRSPLPTTAEVALAAGVTDEQLREIEIYRKRASDPRRQPNDQLAEEVSVLVTADMDAELGKRELRLMTEDSISNPIWIHVDKWIEHRESEPNDVVPSDTAGRLPFVHNGQIMPGDVDRFRFEAKKGTRLVVVAAARDVIPYLADAVPGWFQAVMRVTDELGNEVGFSDSFHFRQDPVIYFEVPRDGRYTVEIRDALYRGREDFVYRVTVGEIPFVTSVFPLGGRVDSDLTVKLTGWNLKHDQMEIKTPPRDDYRPVRWYSAPQGMLGKVRFPMQIDYWKELSDEEPNDSQSTAQSASPPITINGRIDKPGDRDVYRLESAGRIVAEVQARRLGSPLDSMLSIVDAEGNEIAFNDDFVDITQALQTHHADSQLTASIPASGEYFLRIEDAQGKGGVEYSYRLRLRSPQADFDLRVVPSTIIARPGQVVPITVYVLRRDGFNEDVEMALVNAAVGFQLDGAVVPRDKDRIRMTLTMPDSVSGEPLHLEMEGSASRRSGSRRKIVRSAVPAENMMQAFIWHHLVPVENWSVLVNGRKVAKMPFEVTRPDQAVRLPRDGDQWLPVVGTDKKTPFDQLQVALDDPPPGVSATLVSMPSGQAAIKVTTDGELVKPESRGNLLLSVYKESTPKPTESDPAPKPRRTQYGFLPAIGFEIGKR